MTKDQIKRKIGNAFKKYLGATSSGAASALGAKGTWGKLYEAYVLGKLAEALTKAEGLTLVLRNGSGLALKSAPGPINPSYPYVEVLKNGIVVAEIWTDVEFLTLSYDRSGAASAPTNGDYHELDIVIVPPGTSSMPKHDQILLGVECKNTSYDKSLLREILGIRRELSYLADPQPTFFTSWPRTSVPANPGSCLLVYSSDPAVANYAAPGATFGIDFKYQPL